MNQYLIDKIKNRNEFSEKLTFLRDYLIIEGYDSSVCEEMKEFKFEDKLFTVDEMIYTTIIAKDSIVSPKNNIVDSYILEMLFGKENKYQEIDFNNLYYLLDLAGIDPMVSDLILSNFKESVTIDTMLYIKIINDRLKDALPLFKEMKFLKNYVLHRLISILIYKPDSDINKLIADYRDCDNVDDFTEPLIDSIRKEFEKNYPEYYKKIQEPVFFFDDEDVVSLDDLTCLDDSMCFALLDSFLKEKNPYIIDKIITSENHGEGCFLLYLAHTYPEKIEMIEKMIKLSNQFTGENQTTYTSLLILLFADKNMDSFFEECAKLDMLHDEVAPFYMYLGMKKPNMTKDEIAKTRLVKYDLIDALFN